MGLPSGSDGKKSACKAEVLGSIPGLGRSHGEGIATPLQYSCLDSINIIIHAKKASCPQKYVLPPFLVQRTLWNWGCQKSRNSTIKTTRLINNKFNTRYYIFKDSLKTGSFQIQRFPWSSGARCFSWSSGARWCYKMAYKVKIR